MGDLSHNLSAAHRDMMAEASVAHRVCYCVYRLLSSKLRYTKCKEIGYFNYTRNRSQGLGFMISASITIAVERKQVPSQCCKPHN